MSEKGYIKLDRKIFDNWLWQEKPFGKGQAWVDLLLLANYKDRKALSKGQLVTYKKGTVNRSLSDLAERWGWNRKTVSAFLNVLEKDGMIAQKRTTQGTTLTIEKYTFYQTGSLEEGQRTGQRTGQRWDSALDINNKGNKENKGNNTLRGRNEVLEMLREELEEGGTKCD